MPDRLSSVAIVLWLTLAAAIALFASDAAHFSPWEFIIPGPDPWTWLSPLAIVGCPLLLLISRTATSKSFAVGLRWCALALLTLPVLGILALVMFPEQTGYYDPNDPDRQPTGY